MQFSPAAIPQEQPAGLHAHDARAARRHHEEVRAGAYYSWAAQRLPDPGVQNYSFLNHRVSESPYVGNAVAFQTQFRSVQPPQLYVPTQGVFENGLGGIVSGQINFQPLNDPETIY